MDKRDMAMNCPTIESSDTAIDDVLIDASWSGSIDPSGGEVAEDDTPPLTKDQCELITTSWYTVSNEAFANSSEISRE